MSLELLKLPIPLMGEISSDLLNEEFIPMEDLLNKELFWLSVMAWFNGSLSELKF